MLLKCTSNLEIISFIPITNLSIMLKIQATNCNFPHKRVNVICVGNFRECYDANNLIDSNADNVVNYFYKKVNFVFINQLSLSFSLQRCIIISMLCCFVEYLKFTKLLSVSYCLRNVYW